MLSFQVLIYSIFVRIPADHNSVTLLKGKWGGGFSAFYALLLTA